MHLLEISKRIWSASALRLRQPPASRRSLSRHSTCPLRRTAPPHHAGAGAVSPRLSAPRRPAHRQAWSDQASQRAARCTHKLALLNFSIEAGSLGEWPELTRNPHRPSHSTGPRFRLSPVHRSGVGLRGEMGGLRRCEGGGRGRGLRRDGQISTSLSLCALDQDLIKDWLGLQARLKPY
jgi:hypothetical protein